MADDAAVAASTTFVPVAALDQLRPNFVELFEVEGYTVALVVDGEEVHALDGICTHAEYRLGPGLLQRGCIECPMHMAQFDPTDGSVRKGPATEPLERFPTRVVDGVVEVAVDWI